MGNNLMKNIPNILSILRIILSVIFSICIYEYFMLNFWVNIYLLILFIIIGLTDILDGFIARKTGNTSELGAKLDVSADIILVSSSYISLIFLEKVPIWFLILSIIIFLEFIITSKQTNNNDSNSELILVFNNFGKYFGIGCMILPGIIILLYLLVPHLSDFIIMFIILLLTIIGIISFLSRIIK